MRRLFLTLCFLLVASVADALTYYVATTGTNDTCTAARTESTPALTIQFVFACMAASDTVYIRGGTYSQSEFRLGAGTNPPSGSAGNPTLIKSYPGETVTLRTVQGNPSLSIFDFEGLSYITIDGGANRGIIFDGTTGTSTISFEYIMIKFGVAVSNIIVQNFQAINLADGWFSANSGSNITVRNGVIHGSWPAYVGYLAGGTGCGQSICWGYPFYWNGIGHIIENMEVYDVPSFIVHAYCYIPSGCTAPTNMIVRNNKLHNFAAYYWPTTPSGGEGPGDYRGAAILLSVGSGNEAYNNIIYRGSNGIGLGLGSSNSKVYSNTIYDMVDVMVNGYGRGIVSGNETTATIKNNIISEADAAAIVNEGGNTFAKNHCYNSGTTTNCEFVSNPLFVDGPNNDFNLQSGSPAINQGADLGSPYNVDYANISRPQGGLWDIGALERVSALANYFYHDAETSPIAPNNTSTYQWSDAQSLVSRSQTRVKNGAWALRHQFVDPGTDNQVGKVIKFIDPTVGPPGPPFPNSEAWFSAWYYFDSAGGTVWQDPKNYNIWANHMQWKGDNNVNYQSGTPNVHTEVKTVISMRYVNGVRRWMIDGLGFKYTPSGSTTYPIGTFPWNISGEPGKWANTTFVVPLDEWVFLEVYVRMTQQNGAIRVWSGTANEGVLHLLYDMTASDFNFLTAFNQDGSHPNLEGTNQYLYWGIGNYQDWGHASGTYNLYTDDARIANGQVGPTLPEFTEEGPPPPPSSLQVSRKPAVGRIQSSARIQSSGRMQ